MKRLFIILLFPFFSYGQVDTCFTQDEIVDISFTLDSLYALDSLNNEIIQQHEIVIESQKQLIQIDSVQLAYKSKQIELLKENVELYIEREKYLKPRWYDNKMIWFTGGIITAVVTGKFVATIAK